MHLVMHHTKTLITIILSLDICHWYICHSYMSLVYVKLVYVIFCHFDKLAAIFALDYIFCVFRKGKMGGWGF